MSEEKAKVYIVRPSRLGFAVKVKVFINDKLVGKTKGGKYLALDLDPGTHTILSKAENKSIVELNVEAGQEYYLKQIIFPGFLRARNNLEVISIEDGKKAMESCKPAK